jgi:hypothetical protein
MVKDIILSQVHFILSTVLIALILSLYKLFIITENKAECLIISILSKSFSYISLSYTLSLCIMFSLNTKSKPYWNLSSFGTFSYKTHMHIYLLL